jgi:hypothetical protein
MTEYIMLVGLIAILMIAAVNKFGFSVDEAIQGSANAFVLHHPAESYHSDNGGPGSVVLGQATKDGTTVTVTAIAEKDPSTGTYSWNQVVNGGPTKYDEATHGRISSR